MKAIEKSLGVLRFVGMYEVVFKLLILWMKPSRVTIQIKAIQGRLRGNVNIFTEVLDIRLLK